MSETWRRDCGQDRMGAGRPVRRLGQSSRQEPRTAWPDRVLEGEMETHGRVCMYFEEPAGLDDGYEKKRIVKGEAKVSGLSNWN